MPHPELIALDCSHAHKAQLAAVFQPLGWTCVHCRDVPTLYNYLARSAAGDAPGESVTRVVLLRSIRPTQAMTAQVVSHLQRMAGLVVAVMCAGDADSRIRLLESGADVCVSEDCDVTELAAVLRTQLRRHQGGWTAHDLDPSSGGGSGLAQEPLDGTSFSTHRVAEAPHRLAVSRAGDWHANAGAAQTTDPKRIGYGEWQLSYQDWILVNPLGRHVNLTGVERDCMAVLADDQRCELSRKKLGEDGKTNMKSMSVVISRLRKKVRESGAELPLHTVHGNGYVFIGRLVRKAAA